MTKVQPHSVLRPSPGGPARSAGSLVRQTLRILAHLLSLAVFAIIFSMAPAVALALWGLWAIALAFDISYRSRREVTRLRHDAELREAELAAEAEALSDRIFLLEEREARYRSLVEKQGDIVFRRDSEGALSFVNDAFCRAFNCEPAAVLGTDYPFALIAGDLAPISTDRARRLSYDLCLATAAGVRWIAFEDSVVLDETGALIEVQYVGRDVTERHMAQESLRQARMQAEEAARAKSLFLATMSHEIRTPLNGVLGMAGLLERTSLSAEQHNYLSAIRSSGEALLTLIDDILDFSRLDAGKVKLSIASFNLSGLAEEVVELLAPRAHAKALEIGLCVSHGLEGLFEGDQARLRQVLLNLVGNAVKFTERGGVRVVVAAGDDGGVRIEVQDTGPGIPDEAMELIFREFEQAEQGPARRYGGTGLGLAISSRLVHLMNGRIGAVNMPGGGACFTVDLPLRHVRTADSPRLSSPAPHILVWTTLAHEPELWTARLKEMGFATDMADGWSMPADASLLARADVVIFDSYVLGRFEDALDRCTARRIVALRPDERQGVLPRQAELPVDGFLIRPVRHDALMQLVHPERAAALNGPMRALKISAAQARVLVAEDNDINALLTEKLLENMGCEVRRVTDGLEAVEAVSGSRFDLVLMDLHMPHMDGIEATRMLKSRSEAGLACPPIVALTANSGAEERERSLAAGMVDFIVKPVSPETLRAVLDRWVWEPASTLSAVRGSSAS